MMETARAVRDPLSLVFSALADPTRRAILSRLCGGVSTVSEIASDFQDVMSFPAVTKHLKVLERANLISKTQDAQFRRCQIEATALKDVVDWLEPYRAQWEQSFDRLETYLKRTTTAPSRPKNKNKTRKGSSTHASPKAK